VLGAAHQGGAVLVFAAAIWLAHALRRPLADERMARPLQPAFTAR
jgi:hypothetical protein